MNLFLSKKFLFVYTLLFFLSLYFPAKAAGVPLILGYQGRLTDSGGNLLGGSGGTTYYFKFSIWNIDTGGTSGTNRLWPASDPSTVTTTVRQGVFNVNIGDTTNGSNALNYDFNNSKDIYLQVEVSSDNNTFETLSPRLRISSTVFAQLSGAVSGTGPSSFGTTTPFGTSQVSVEATSTQSTGITIRGIIGQLANLFQIQDYTGLNLFVVDNAGKVGIGTSTPGRKLEVVDVNSNPQLRLSQSGSVYGEAYVDSAGDMRLSATGGNIRGNDENLWVCSGGGCGVDTPADKGNAVVENAVIFGNKFKLKQIDASTTVMYDTTNDPIFEFDEGQ